MRHLARILFVGLITSVVTGANGRAETSAQPVDEPALHRHEVTDSILPSGTYNIVTYAAPRAVPLMELGLKDVGLRGGPVFRVADELRIFASRDVMEQSPKARLWLNTRENAWWYHTGGEGSAEGVVLQPGEVLVIVTKASTEILAWKNPLR